MPWMNRLNDGIGRKTIAVLGIIVLAAIFTACGKAPGAVEPKRQTISGVGVGSVQMREFTVGHQTVGAVKAANVSALASKLMGSVLAVHVRQGERVKAGQLLVEIEARDVAAQMNATQAQRQLTQATYERYRTLVESGAISRHDFDVAATQRNVAEANYQQAVATLAFSHVTAPMDGVISDRKVDAGSMVSPGQVLLTVDDPSSYVVETNLEERWATRLSVGAPVKISIPAMELIAEGRVLEFSPAVDAASRTFYVKVSLSGAGLRSGLYARVEFPGAKEQILTAPSTAVGRKGQLDGVYVVSSDGVVTFRPIKRGRSFGQDVEVLSGLSSGDKIIVSGLEKAIDGGKLAEGTKS